MNDPHANQPLATAGAPLASAPAAAVLIHGRGADAPGILRLAEAVDLPQIAWRAPQAADNAWYPHRFIAPFEQNEPWLSSALRRIEAVIAEIRQAGIPDARIALIGFSQGACLASEYAARNARRWGAIGALSGGLIGPPGTPFEYPGSLAGTPVLVGCSDVDPHIPVERVQETSQALRTLDAEVDERIYPGMGHSVNDEEIAWLHDTLCGLAS